MMNKKQEKKKSRLQW